MRKIPALLLSAGVLVSLSACANPFAPGCTPTSAGDASSVVTASGKIGDKPSVDFPTPIYTDSTERSVLVEGEGEPVRAGQPVRIQFTILNGADGEVLGQSKFDDMGQFVTVGADTTLDVITDGLACSTVGSRIAIVGSAKDTHNGAADPANGVGANDSFVYVVDLMEAWPAKANGSPQLPQNGLPAVVLAPNGAPGVTVPNEDPPTDLKVAELQKADGEKVKAGDAVLMKYTGVLWSDGGVFDSTWEEGQAVVRELKDGGGLPSGVVEGLTGKTVGSQILIVAPPEHAYGDQGAPGIPSGSTLVYVVDILGIVDL